MPTKEQLEKAIKALENKEKIHIDYSNGKDLTAVILVGDEAEATIRALEKQLPMKVKRVCDYYDSFKYCPRCDCNVRREMTFCQECGQALDWSDSNGKPDTH